MKAVLRLVYSYFMGSRVMRAITLGGLILLSINFVIVVTQPQSGEKLWIAFIGIIVFFVGSSFMPVIFGRLARSHVIGVLPYGRLKLLASAFLTTFIVALPTGVLSPASFGVNVSSLPEIMEHPGALAYLLQLAAITFTSAMLLVGWLYLAMWFMTSERNMLGAAKGLLVIVLLVFAPARDIQDLTVSAQWNVVQIAVVWTVFGSGFLLWPRFKAARARRGRSAPVSMSGVFSRDTVGREFDLMLGTANPWTMIAALALPILIASRFVFDLSAIWLFFLTIYSTVAGAIAGEAAGRSRALWLRGNWSRAALFSQVERSFWRYSAIVLGSLILVLLAIGGYAGFPPAVLVAGVPLLALGTALSLYLGLMVTRGLRWIEGLVGAIVMLTLMAVAVSIMGEETDLFTVFALEAGLAVLAIVLRSVARRRWMRIDWMLCRPDRALVARGA
jgi:hypothetical protein